MGEKIMNKLSLVLFLTVVIALSLQAPRVSISQVGSCISCPDWCEAIPPQANSCIITQQAINLTASGIAQGFQFNTSTAVCGGPGSGIGAVFCGRFLVEFPQFIPNIISCGDSGSTLACIYGQLRQLTECDPDEDENCEPERRFRITTEPAVIGIRGSIDLIPSLSYELIEQSPDFYLDTITIPANAKLMVFLYQFLNLGDGDWLTLHFEGVELISIPGDILGSTDTFTGIADVSQFAGQTGIMVATLQSTGQTNARVLVSEGLAFSSTGTLEDVDEDTVLNDGSDNCPLNPNALQEDDDNDGVGNLCDNCPINANPNQQDTNNNGIGDICDNSLINLLGLDPSQAGILNTFSANNATPNGDVTFIWSLGLNAAASQLGAEISTRVAPDDICQGLDTPLVNPRILTTVQADGNGDASFSFNIPLSVAGITAHLQAVDITSCTGSNVNTETIDGPPMADPPVLLPLDPGTAGVQNTLSATDATPNSDVRFIWSFNAGSQTANNICPGFQSGILNPRTLPLVQSDGAGTASLNVNVPANLTGVSLVLQAVDIATCTGSNVNPETL